MPRPKSSRREARLRTQALGPQAVGLRLWEEVLRSAPAQLEKYVAAWTRDLSVASSALQGDIREGNQKRVPEAAAQLERLAEAIRRAPDQLEKHLVEGSAGLTSARTALEQKLREREEAAERKLQAATTELSRLVAEHQLLETERGKTARALREIHARFEAAFGNAPIGMALVDTEGHWLEVNDALCRITGYSRKKLKATTLAAITDPDYVDLDAEQKRDLLSGRIPSYNVEKRYRHARGYHLWVLVTVSVVRDEQEGPLYVISQVQDISERKELAERLEYLVDHDFLTALFNRRRFEQELAQEVQRASRYGHSGAVLLIDLDHFKDVNDAFGHKAGDDLLKGVAATLKQRVRQTDVLARVGGDEFAVLLPQTDAEQAEIVADGIVKTLHQHVVMLGDQSIRATASVGLVLFDGLSEAELLAYADLAMYEAKAAGRDRFTMYRPTRGRKERVSARLEEAERIRKALEEDRLLLEYQPILELKANKVQQYELLLRLPNDQGGEPFPPSSFLYVAERCGLIQGIDCWVAAKAIAMIAEQQRAGRRLVLHVNLSGKSIGDPKVTGFIEDALTRGEIDPSCLIFEVTETAAIANIEEAKAFAQHLRARGCQLALDDFGSGFGSFYYVKTLPFDYLKIDGDFIRGIAANTMDQLVVRAIVDIARGLGKKTIAEFVATEDTLRLVRQIGVDYAQGYHVGRPRPLLDVLPPA
jgi:diguanylate cyclase (GGDEF)-like protein/PAS domain S-box-containing protein